MSMRPSQHRQHLPAAWHGLREATLVARPPVAPGRPPAAPETRSHLGNTFANALPATGHPEYVRYQT